MPAMCFSELTEFIASAMMLCIVAFHYFYLFMALTCFRARALIVAVVARQRFYRIATVVFAARTITHEAISDGSAADTKHAFRLSRFYRECNQRCC